MRAGQAITRLLLANVAGVALLLLVRPLVRDSVTPVDIEAWGIFFAVVGVVYAVIAGFLLAQLLTRYHQLSSRLHEELNALEDIRDFLVYVDDGQQNTAAKLAIREALVRYIRNIIENEWPRMTAGERNMDTDTCEELYGVMRAVEKIRPEDQSDIIALRAIIDHVADVTTHRTERLDMVGHGLTPPLRVLLYFMSAIISIGFILMGIQSLSIHVFMVVSVITSIGLLLIVMFDLNKPFAGIWNIDAEPFLAVEQRLRKALGSSATASQAVPDAQS